MSPGTERRAQRLALLYPRQWRRRYPDFADVLAADLEEHRWRATRDVCRAAAGERLRAAGLVPTTPTRRSRYGFALVFAALVPFTGLSAGMWSQLRTETAGDGTPLPSLDPTDLLLAIGTVVASASLAVAAVLVAARARRRRGPGSAPTKWRTLPGPSLTLAVAVVALSACGWAADRSGWYSPAAAALPHVGLAHVLTLWARGVVAAITPAWVHPGLFARLPTLDLVATLAAPVATVVAGAALLSLFGRLSEGPRRRYLVASALLADGAMFLCTAATIRWLIDGQPGGASLSLHPAQVAPGHTPIAVAVLLGLLAVAAAAGTSWVFRHPEPPPERSAHLAP